MFLNCLLVTIMEFQLQNKADLKKRKGCCLYQSTFFLLSSFYKVYEIVYENTHHKNRKNVKYHKNSRPQKMCNFL